MYDTDLQRVVVGAAAGVGHVQRSEGRVDPWILNAGGGVRKIVHAVDDVRSRRIEVVEGEQMHSTRADITNG